MAKKAAAKKAAAKVAMFRAPVAPMPLEDAPPAEAPPPAEGAAPPVAAKASPVEAIIKTEAEDVTANDQSRMLNYLRYKTSPTGNKKGTEREEAQEALSLYYSLSSQEKKLRGRFHQRRLVHKVRQLEVDDDV